MDSRPPQLSTISAIVAHNAQQQPAATALVFGARRTSYATLAAHADAVAVSLLAAGLKPGARIAYLGKNSDLYFELVLGVAAARMVITPLNWRLAARELEQIVADSGAEMMFTTAEFAASAHELAAAAPGVRAIVVMDGDDAATDFAAWRDAAAGAKPATVARPDEVFLQLYTSGTTGLPKGVMLTHDAYIAARRAGALEDRPWDVWAEDDVIVVAMPVFHISGTGWGLCGLYAGARVVVLPEFGPAAVMDAIVAESVTKLFAVPSAIQMLFDDPRAESGAMRSLRQISYGGSPMPLGLLKRCLAQSDADFVQMYGMTETCGVVVALKPEDHRDLTSPRLESAGCAMAGTRVRVIDDAGDDLPPGEIGEILVQSLNNMTGYWNQPEATARTIGADNWLRTGDAGYLDEDGYLFIRDRMKDMIISGGENIYPIEIENVLSGHPSVASVAVIGVPDARWGEAVKAVVVLKPGASVDADALLGWARGSIAAYKLPKSVDFVEALPLSPAGKILKRALRDIYWAGEERAVS